jgi:hypothetical protein
MQCSAETRERKLFRNANACFNFEKRAFFILFFIPKKKIDRAERKHVPRLVGL